MDGEAGGHGLRLAIEQDLLTLKGEKKVEREEKGRNYHRVERRCGTFMRTIQLPTDVVADQAEAVVRNGILHIRLPKTEAARPRKVKVDIKP